MNHRVWLLGIMLWLPTQVMHALHNRASAHIVAMPTSIVPSLPYALRHAQLPASLELEQLFQQAALPDVVSHTIRAILQNTEKHQIVYNEILTVIDYSLPANEKRLWVFDLRQQKCLYHTYVSHGINSGAKLSHRFSNRYNSRASSIGVYRTNKTYYGREGLTLKLDGLDLGFNDNAVNRAIVMHGGWYMDEHFISKYGRPGRSWGCPALPMALKNAIINTIKEGSLMVMYYPSSAWVAHSKFLKEDAKLPQHIESQRESMLPEVLTLRGTVLLAHLALKKNRLDEDAIMAIPAPMYQSVFQKNPPLERMLRRQVKGIEFIAVNPDEFEQLAYHHLSDAALSALSLVQPRLVMTHGYYETEMNQLDYGAIQSITVSSQEPHKRYTLNFANHPAVKLYTSPEFIRWLGL